MLITIRRKEMLLYLSQVSDQFRVNLTLGKIKVKSNQQKMMPDGVCHIVFRAILKRLPPLCKHPIDRVFLG